MTRRNGDGKQGIAFMRSGGEGANSRKEEDESWLTIFSEDGPGQVVKMRLWLA